jgi:antitoxin (DNA-binding transcriptional repressor) of toxin-antitoxin stability system
MSVIMAITKTVGIGEFRQNAPHFIHLVEETSQTIIITRRHRPVAELRPVARTDRTLAGSVTVAPGVDLTAPVSEVGDWESSR